MTPHPTYKARLLSSTPFKVQLQTSQTLNYFVTPQIQELGAARQREKEMDTPLKLWSNGFKFLFKVNKLYGAKLVQKLIFLVLGNLFLLPPPPALSFPPLGMLSLVGWKRGKNHGFKISEARFSFPIQVSCQVPPSQHLDSLMELSPFSSSSFFHAELEKHQLYKRR